MLSFVRRHRQAIVVAAILLLAVGVRLWGIGFGLPYDLTADEPHQIVQALKIGAGEGGPLVRMWHTIGKGGLDYALFFEYSVLYVVWWLTGRVREPVEFALAYLRDPTAFYLVGRITIAMMGALTCAVVYAIARRIYGEWVAVGAALIGAVAYYHAADSHVINVHVAMTFALWAGVLAFVRFEASGRRSTLVIAGLLCGAAIALAYTAVLGLLVLLAAMATSPARPRAIRAFATDAVVLCAAALLSIGLMSPDLIAGAALLLNNFSQLAGAGSGEQPETLRDAIDGVTILRAQDWTAYLNVLAKPYNVVATVAACAGVLAGFWRRERWTLLFAAAAACLLLILSASSRGVSESYMLAMTPALWILAGRGLFALAGRRIVPFAVGAAAVAAVPLFWIVRDDYMLTRPDTRVLAKTWIEANVASGSRILMDGMRFRFVQGVPLNPDATTVNRRLNDLEASELSLSGQMLALYREAAARVEGPTYELHSTMYGLEVQELDYYVREGFDYVVISSFNEKRYETEDEQRRHPGSARFYRLIRTHPRFRQVFTVEPRVWVSSGPTITVYEVLGPAEGSPDVTEAPQAANRVLVHHERPFLDPKPFGERGLPF